MLSELEMEVCGLSRKLKPFQFKVKLSSSIIQ
jgi:hypothetical protein